MSRVFSLTHTHTHTQTNMHKYKLSTCYTQSDLLTQALAHWFLHTLYCISLWQDALDPYGEFKCHLLSVLLRFNRKKKNWRAMLSVHNATATKCVCDTEKEKNVNVRKFFVSSAIHEWDGFLFWNEFSSYFPKMLFEFWVHIATWDHIKYFYLKAYTNILQGKVSDRSQLYWLSALPSFQQ